MLASDWHRADTSGRSLHGGVGRVKTSGRPVPEVFDRIHGYLGLHDLALAAERYSKPGTAI